MPGNDFSSLGAQPADPEAKSKSPSKGSHIVVGAISSTAIDLSNQNQFGKSSTTKPLFGAGAEVSAQNPASAKTTRGLDAQDDASMRSKSPISSKSNVDARNSGISAGADKGSGLFGGQGKKDSSSSGLFGASAPKSGGGLFGKPPPSDLMRESPAFGSGKTQESANGTAAGSLFGGKKITDKPADQDQPGIRKPTA